MTNIDELEDIVDWLTWYIPKNSGLSVSLVGTPDLIAWLQARDARGNIELLSQIADNVFETILVRKGTARNYLKVFMLFNAKLECIDKHFFSFHESVAFVRLYRLHNTDSLRDMRKRLEHASVANYKRVYSKYKGCKRSFVLGTGPSIQKILETDVTPDDLVIACNSLVKNQKVLAHTQPAILAFADPVFHFGRSLYARQFREQLMSVITSTKCVCILPPEHGLLLALHYPSLIPRLIIVSTISGFNLPTPDSRTVQLTDNVMTLYMLPIASAMAQEVYVIGADGRIETDNYFWKHDQESQYGDLLESAITTHPSFFRDRNYEAYFRTHCVTMETMIREGEVHGVRYYSLSHSTVPALENRVVENVLLREQSLEQQQDVAATRRENAPQAPTAPGTTGSS